jgi:hypothetical protein
MSIHHKTQFRYWPIYLLFIIAINSSSKCFAWWDNTFPYRAQIVITNGTATNVTDKVFEITLSSTSLHPSYSWTANGNDLRLYESDDATAIPFYIEYWNQGPKTAHIFLKTSLNAFTSKTIYLYYGNTSVGTVSNLVAVLTDVGLRFHTRQGPFTPGLNPGLTLAQVQAAFDAIPDSAGYGCAPVSDFTNIRNSGTPIFGSANNIFFRAEHWFYVDPADAGEWRFEYSGDYGDGGVLYLDNVEMHERWGEDLWWGNNWANTNEILRTSGVDNNSDTPPHPNLAVGWHVLKFFGSEQCCDGGTSVRFRKPTSGGTWLNWSTANHANIRSPGCLIGAFSSVITPPNLNTSTKVGIDLNGGNLLANETIRYTITLNESNVQVTEKIAISDNMTAQPINSMTFVTLPSGVISSIVGDVLSVSGINIAASGTKTIVYDVIIDGGTPPGTNINNSFTYTSPAGDATLYQGTINAPALTVYTPPTSVTKQLYVYNNGGAPQQLNRFIDTTQNDVTITKGTTATPWVLTPTLATNLTLLAAPNISVNLILSSNSNANRNITITIGDTTGTNIATLTTTQALTTTPTLYTFTLPITKTTVASGNPITMTISNNTGGGGVRNIIIRDVQPAINTSVINLPVVNVINISNFIVSSDIAGLNPITEATAGSIVYVTATVTDPFGFADITGITFDITNATPALQASYTEASPEVTSVSAAGSTKVYRLQYTVPAFPIFGNWIFRATAKEGAENTVTATSAQTLPIKALPLLSVLKSTNVTSASPLVTVINYVITLTNMGLGDAANIVIKDTLSPHLAIRTQYNGVGSTPFSCLSGCGTSGVSFTIGTETYNDINNLWNHTLTSGAGGAPAGYDGAVTEWRIPLTGNLNNSSVVGPNTNTYSIQYQGIAK